MNKCIDDLKRLSHRLMDEKAPYYEETRKYFGTRLKGMDQIELIEAIKMLNIHELKQTMAAGIPGDAMHVANRRLKDLKQEIKAYIEEKGKGASFTTKVDVPKEVEGDELEGVCTSEERRKSNSGEMDKTSTDSGT